MFHIHHSWKQHGNRDRRRNTGRRWCQTLSLLMVMLCIGIVLCGLVPSIASAKMSYDTKYYDYNVGKWLYIQPLFVPDGFITGESEFGPAFSQPNDLFVTGDDQVYVADTGNNRVVVLNRQYKVTSVIGTEEGKGKLNAPEGVFVDNDGTVYVADTGNRRIVLYGPDGKFIREYVRPTSKLLPDENEYYFVPSKLIVDARGVMYIVVKGSYQGILRMNSKGEFTGFFGANKTPLTLLDRMKRMILTKEQLSKELALRPAEVRNIASDPDGFILTTTQEQNAGQVKKLNASGVDALHNNPFANAYNIVDVAADQGGLLYVLDGNENTDIHNIGKITIHTPTGRELFTFGDEQQHVTQLGVMSQPTSLAVNSSREIFMSDAHLNMIQLLRPTPFGNTVLTAIKYDLDGNYQASQPYWQKVTDQNDMISIAYRGMGHSLNRAEDYQGAMKYYKIAYDAEGYSNSFWNIRLLWIQQYFVYLVVGLIAGMWLLLRGVRFMKRLFAARAWSQRMIRYGSEIGDAWYLLFHPYDGFYRLKDRRISYTILALFVVLTVGVHLASRYWIGFVFSPIDRSKISLVWTLGTFIIPWLTWVIANYLVSTVKDGEGRFREVLQSSIYAMVPYVVWMPILIILSHVIVLEERVLFDAGVHIMELWIVVLFFVMSQVIHNFEFMETTKNMIISMFTILAIWLFIVIMSGLGYNLFDFFGQIYREVRIDV